MRDADGAPLYFISQLRDITIERAANEELERRVQARTAELQALNKQLELFAFGVSHDLRAPLRAIDSFASVLEQRHAGQLDADGREHLQRIRKAAGDDGRPDRRPAGTVARDPRGAAAGAGRREPARRMGRRGTAGCRAGARRRASTCSRD